MSHRYVNSYKSSNTEEKIDGVGDSRPKMTDCFAQKTELMISDEGMSS